LSEIVMIYLAKQKISRLLLILRLNGYRIIYQFITNNASTKKVLKFMANLCHKTLLS